MPLRPAASRPRAILSTTLVASAASLIVTVPPTCSADNSCVTALASAFNSCAAARVPCTIALSAGIYALSAPRGSPWLSVNVAHDVAVIGAGPANTILMVADMSQTFVLFRCVNVSFAEFALDLPRPPFTLAHVRASATGVSTLDFDGAAYPIDTAAFPWLRACQAVIGYDLANGRMARGGVDDYFLTDSPLITYSGKAPALTMSLPISLPVGADVIVRHQVYGFDAFTAHDSDYLAFRNVTIYAAGGVGLVTVNVSGIELDGFCVKKGAGRVMSTTADGFHAMNPRGGAIIVRRCMFEGQGDDGINTPTLYTDIESVSADRHTLTVENTGIFAVGDSLNFFNRSSLLLLGNGLVASLQSPATIALVDPLPAFVSRYDLINNAASYADYVEVTDTLFKDNRARGALLKSSNVYAARNVFDHTTGSAIETEVDGCYWYEGHPVRNWTVTNNTMIGCNYATASSPGDVYVNNAVPVFSGGVPTQQCVVFSAAPIHADVTITHNVFVQDAGQSAVFAYAVAGINVSGNSIRRTAGTPEGDLIGVGCTQTQAVGNLCNGGACNVSGL